MATETIPGSQVPSAPDLVPEHITRETEKLYTASQTRLVLMRLFRGTGPDGLPGMRPVSGRFIHPLLAWSREEIVAFLEHSGQPWRTDATNLDGDNLRARLRREADTLARLTGWDRAEIDAEIKMSVPAVYTD